MHIRYISFKSKLSLYCHNKINRTTFSNHFGSNPEVNSKPCLTSKTEGFAKIINIKTVIDCFCKTLHLRCLTGFRLWNHFGVLPRRVKTENTQLLLKGLSVGKTWKVLWNFFLEGKNLISQNLLFNFWGLFFGRPYRSTGMTFTLDLILPWLAYHMFLISNSLNYTAIFISEERFSKYRHPNHHLSVFFICYCKLNINIV